MNTIYVILLAAISIMLLVFRFLRVDQTKNSADATSAPKTDDLLAGGTGQKTEPQDLFTTKLPEEQVLAEEGVTAKTDDALSAPEIASPEVDTETETKAEPEIAANPEPTVAHETEGAQLTRLEQELRDDHTLIIYAISHHGVFTGTALLELAAVENLRLENNVFYKYDEENKVCYRVANGTGELGFEAIGSANFQTQIITLTIAFPDTRNPVRAYNDMRRFAELMVQNLGAMLKDAEQNRISSQTLNYYKDNVVSYQQMNRKRLG